MIWKTLHQGTSFLIRLNEKCMVSNTSPRSLSSGVCSSYQPTAYGIEEKLWEISAKFFLCQKYIFPGLHNYSVRFLSISIPLFRGSFKDLFYSKRQTSGDLKLLTSSLRRSVIDYFASQWESIYIINYTKGCMTVCGFVWEFQHKDYSYEMHVMHIICHVYKGKNTWHLGPHILHLQETNKFIIFFFLG